jgi:hypothetical protein
MIILVKLGMIRIELELVVNAATLNPLLYRHSFPIEAAEPFL